MRSLGTTTVLLALLLTGCGSGSDDADDVPTITTRPSTPASSPVTESTEPTTAPATTSQPTAPSSTPTQDATPTETAGPSPEPPTDDPVGPTTYRQAQARIDGAGGAGTEAARFSTAGDVVYCLLDDPVIGPACELRRGFIQDEVCAGTADGVGRIETFEGRARPVCNTDTIREPGAAEIDDGVVVTNGDVECLVGAADVTCLDTGARAGFFLAPGEYHVF